MDLELFMRAPIYACVTIEFLISTIMSCSVCLKSSLELFLNTLHELVNNN